MNVINVHGEKVKIGILHWHNPSGLTTALRLTQPLAEKNTTNISRVEKRQVRMANNLTTFTCWLSWNQGASASWNTQGLSRPEQGLLYLLFFPYNSLWLKFLNVLYCISIFNKFVVL